MICEAYLAPIGQGLGKKKQDEENEGMKKIELWRHEIICMNNLPSHTGQLNVMVIYNYTIISLLVIYTTLSNCLRRNDLQIPVQLLTTTTCASGMVPPVQRWKHHMRKVPWSASALVGTGCSNIQVQPPPPPTR